MREITLAEACDRIRALGLRPVIRKTFSAAACLYDAVHGRDALEQDRIILKALGNGYDGSALDSYALRPAA